MRKELDIEIYRFLFIVKINDANGIKYFVYLMYLFIFNNAYRLQRYI